MCQLRASMKLHEKCKNGDFSWLPFSTARRMACPRGMPDNPWLEAGCGSVMSEPSVAMARYKKRPLSFASCLAADLGVKCTGESHTPRPGAPEDDAETPWLEAAPPWLEAAPPWLEAAVIGRGHL